jgi:hypothetical protein
MGESDTKSASLRRSRRVQIAMPVIVHGANFRETTFTVTVNAHGGFVRLKAKVAQGDLIWLINPKTTEELQVKIVFLGNPHDGKILVGVEFTEASPLFWRINFPPQDWHASPERKRPGSNPLRK